MSLPHSDINHDSSQRSFWPINPALLLWQSLGLLPLSLTFSPMLTHYCFYIFKVLSFFHPVTTQNSPHTLSHLYIRGMWCIFQVLIAAHQPAYELRYNQMESIFLPAIDMYGHSFHPENLQKLILSETSIFDVLHAFFYHTNVAVRMASLEVNPCA